MIILSRWSESSAAASLAWKAVVLGRECPGLVGAMSADPALGAILAFAKIAQNDTNVKRKSHEAAGNPRLYPAHTESYGTPQLPGRDLRRAISTVMERAYLLGSIVAAGGTGSMDLLVENPFWPALGAALIAILLMRRALRNVPLLVPADAESRARR
ncbi:hypothetical protein E2493_06160 [Sphingomonas parva]|uniref:Uncharacterized protein n=2 Tax=Sphingomonas parva TaxID=2555898 RepID=A0A4Y8ZX73_9SPHN|nr:hypothetical protein E2493_06160 [Sphingomonas parva]